MSISNRRVILFVCFLVFMGRGSEATGIRVGLLSLNRPLSLTVGISSGEYRMPAAGRVIAMKEFDNLLVSKAGDKVLVTTGSGLTVLLDSLVLRAADTGACFSLRNNLQPLGLREYYGHLIIKAGLSSLLAINELDVSSYLMGVVQTEAGYKGNIEYYKTQSLLARTYLYSHLDRHQDDAYNVCDNTHCQAYHGRSVLEIISDAVEATRGMVLVDADNYLVFAPFHSNCGGQTESSERVWLTGMPHLKSVTDPYCSYSRNAAWIRQISLDDWIEYLVDHGYEHSADEDLGYDQLSRKETYTAGSFSFPLIKIRDDWALRSTFFSAKIKAGNLILEGRGYGHGVGLCQEGARVMADRGFSMEEIIGFYFSGLQITDIGEAKKPLVLNRAF